MPDTIEAESMVHIGDSPTKKDTGELEPILPDWLKEARQQNREAAEEEAATKPKIPTVEKPDLLAGLASQADSGEEDVPDWLAGLNPVKENLSSTSVPAEETPSDFFSQFNQNESQQLKPSVNESEEPTSEPGDELSGWFSQVSSETSESLTSEPETSQDELGWMSSSDESQPSFDETPADETPEDLSWLHNLEAASKKTDELSASEQPNVIMPDENQMQTSSQEDLSWLDTLGGVEQPSSENPVPAQSESSQEDLSWLSNLGDTEPETSAEESASSQPQSAQEDLSWLNNLGRDEHLVSIEPASSPPESSQDDLGWLNNLGRTEQGPSIGESQTQPESLREDLSWLDNLGEIEPGSAEESAPAQPESSLSELRRLDNLSGTEEAPSEEATSFQPESLQGDLGWLNDLSETGQAPASEEVPSEPMASEGLDRLDKLGRTEEQAFFEEPAPTQPVDELDNTDWLKNLEAQSEPSASDMPASQYSPPRTAPLSKEAAESIPDWLKSATEEPAMPPPGGATLDWFAEHDKSAEKHSVPTSAETFDQTPPEPASGEHTIEGPSGEPESASTQAVDSMFSADMPDWLTQEPETTDETAGSTTAVSEDDTLAPVELPSWVQAMRPVESVLEDSSASTADQITEKEGPLAGFRGVIPFGPIGSSRKPKAVSLKLQVTDEQQASAVLLEEIINSETLALPIKSSPFVASQRALRWILAGLFWVVLGITIFLGTRSMPIVPPASVNQLINLVSSIPDNSQVLVIVDYEPSLAGELEPASGPLLDQLALTRHSTFVFLSMSPTGSALVERLLNDTNISKPREDGGLGYQPGEQYFNIGYLPGGSAGVLGFVENPKMAMPDVPVNTLSDFAAVIVLTDHPEAGRVWIEQLEQAKQKDPILASKPLLMVSSAQAGPMLQPYVSSGQVAGMINGLSDAAKYEFVNNSRPGITGAYWDAFGVGLMMAVIAIVLGSLWSLFMGMRARRATTEQG